MRAWRPDGEGPIGEDYIVKMVVKETGWTGEDLIFLSQVAGIFGFH